MRFVSDRFLVATLATVLGLAAATPRAHAAVIDFDDTTAPLLFSEAQALTGQYSGAGVTFSGTGAVLDQDSDFLVSGFSPRNFAAYSEASDIDVGGENRVGQASDVLTFSTALSAVSFLVGSGLSPFGFEAFAYDASNTLLASASLTLDSALQLVSLSGTGITRVEYGLVDAFEGDAFVVDDLDLTAVGAVPEPLTLTLMGVGLAGVTMVRARRQRRC